MHESVRAYIAERAHLIQGPILEIGSLDVNGNVRDLLPPDAEYIGIDIVGGNGVDKLYDGDVIPFDSQTFATVLCLEVFEHCKNPFVLAEEIVRVLAPGGFGFVTARGNGFQLHHEPDRWRYMPGTLREIFLDFGAAGVMETEDPQYQHPGVFLTIAATIGADA